MHPKLPVIWILKIFNCISLARDTTWKKNSAVNQTVLQPSNTQESWCLVLLSAAQHCALLAFSAWWRGTCASLSTDSSLSTTAWLSQPNLELLGRIWASHAILHVLSAGGPVPSARLSAPLSYSLLPSFKWHSEVLQRVQGLALLALLISSTAPNCAICPAPSHSASVQLSQEYGKVVVEEHSWKCRFLFIY